MSDEPQNSPEIVVIGNVVPSGHRAGNIYDTSGISPTIMENHGYPAFIAEPTKEDNYERRCNSQPNIQPRAKS